MKNVKQDIINPLAYHKHIRAKLTKICMTVFPIDHHTGFRIHLQDGSNKDIFINTFKEAQMLKMTAYDTKRSEPQKFKSNTSFTCVIRDISTNTPTLKN